MKFLNNFEVLELDELVSKKNNLAELDIFEEALFIVKNYLNKKRNILIVKSTLYNANRLYDEVCNYIDHDDCLIYGFNESLINESFASNNELINSRLEALIATTQDNPKIYITHGYALLKPIMNHLEYKDNILNITINDVIDISNIKNILNRDGYNRVSKVTNLLEYSIRGNVIDIYSPYSSYPVRIDLFGDTVDNIKLFDVATQRSRIKINNFKIYPGVIYANKTDEILEYLKPLCSDKVFDEIQTQSMTNNEIFCAHYYNLCSSYSSFLDYLSDVTVITSSYKEIITSLENIINENTSYINELYNDDKSYPHYNYIYDSDIIIDDLNIKNFQDNKNDLLYRLSSINNYKDLSLFKDDLIKYIKKGYRIFLYLTKNNEIKTIKKLLQDNDIDSVKIVIEHEYVSRGFINDNSKILVVTSKELFNNRTRKSNFFNKYQNAVDILDLEELKINDYVVHSHHGIGQYHGIIQLKIDDIYKDFIFITYKNNEKLYIPIEQFTYIKKYSSSEGHVPKINNLGGSEWTKVKNRVKAKIDDMMDELLELYSKRSQKIGFAYSPDNDMLNEFENDFIYELTKDQARAINDVKKDMESNLVMDRLICGDVGYGKTEVAIRAIFKAVMDTKQIAFLCPTTILARQHYLTLLDRFKEYPINIVLVTRNTTAKNIKLIAEQLLSGNIDVVVGTHKLLNKVLTFKDLGLLVIDEEQRFGVAHKERVKQMKANIDVLTMSATPIPRTLQMSLSGLRKMSLLQTPPVNRLPIQTFVVEKNKHLIKDVIEKELARNGQTFYLYNRTEDIDRVAQSISDLIPDAKVAMIHGKMPKNIIEDTMEAFDNNNYNVLVCTTIIETGIDIPNANTIIIENANHFGLAQLYQIKGRVGRSDRVAYAYLMYQQNKILSEEASKRLQAIKELTKLGSGYKIALRDLAIRGAGDILGKTQSGNIDSVGYDMYLDMLQEAINKRNNVTIDEEEIVISNIKNIGYIPSEFEMDDVNKIKLYQKIYSLKKLEDFKDVEAEIRDYYGKIPSSINDLIDKRRFDILVSKIGKVKVIDNVNDISLQVDININDKNKVKKIFTLCDDYLGLFRVVVKYQKIHIEMNKTRNFLKSINDILINLGNILEE